MMFTQGNLLEADVDAVVNTVNTVGVMGKGIALMFRERFPENFRAYAAACKADKVQVGEMFVQPTNELAGPRWIVNFPTKQHWRSPTQLVWIETGLRSLRRVITEHDISSIAIPPLGCGNGGLDWGVVRPLIESTLGGLDGVEIHVYEPAAKYQNVAKRRGVEKLTPARALVSEMVRRYWVLGIGCTILEIQKLSWFLERTIRRMGVSDPLNLDFSADKYGPYAHRLTHLLDSLDGSYLHCEKRLADAGPLETIWFDSSRKQRVQLYLHSGAAKEFVPALEATDELIDGFQSPLCMEALSTVDWLVHREGCEPTLAGIRAALDNWPGGQSAAQRKQRIFTDHLLSSSLERLGQSVLR